MSSLEYSVPDREHKNRVGLGIIREVTVNAFISWWPIRNATIKKPISPYLFGVIMMTNLRIVLRAVKGKWKPYRSLPNLP
jgi:hypothetical protein